MTKAKPYQYRQPAPLYGETDAATLQQAMERSAAARQHRTIKSNAPSRDATVTTSQAKVQIGDPSHDNADPILADILDRLATIEAYIDDRQRAAKSQAERAKAYRDRKKQQVTA